MKATEMTAGFTRDTNTGLLGKSPAFVCLIYPSNQPPPHMDLFSLLTLFVVFGWFCSLEKFTGRCGVSPAAKFHFDVCTVCNEVLCFYAD